jgi:hypothetical protein
MKGESSYCSVHRALGAIAPALGPDLVSEATWGRLLAFSGRHAALGQAQYLELRLGAAGSDQVDLLVSAATNHDRHSLRRRLGTGSGCDPALDPLRGFLAHWTSPDSMLYDQVPLTWLEFDHMEATDHPVGSIGVCLAPAYLDPHATLPPQSPDQVLPVLFESLRASRGEGTTPDERAAFERCFQHLPGDALWIHLSVMLSRDPVELKLYGVFPQAEVLPYLARIGWAGDRGAVARLIERTCTPERTAGQIYLDLPVTGMFDPAQAGLGIVFGQQHLRLAPPGPERHPGRTPLLDLLTSDGLCTPAQRSSLIDWSGVDRAVPVVEASAGLVDVQRWLDIKVAYHPRRPLMAKAYLGFLARPARRACDEIDLSSEALLPRPPSRPSPTLPSLPG